MTSFCSVILCSQDSILQIWPAEFTNFKPLLCINCCSFAKSQSWQFQMDYSRLSDYVIPDPNTCRLEEC
ncbi:putative T-complex protein 1 subunit theta [Fusarium oxysporum f. sp. albedinis]|nr:putative T-complex protein 1 subunit theta [Fusarium oxysporum f. sp. albedinis]